MSHAADERGKMDDDTGVKRRNEGSRDGGLGEITVRAAQRGHGVAAARQLHRQVRTDEAGATGDQDALLRYHSIVRARPSSSSTCASKPSSSRALSTFGMRSSTSA